MEAQEEKLGARAADEESQPLTHARLCHSGQKASGRGRIRTGYCEAEACSWHCKHGQLGVSWPMCLATARFLFAGRSRASEARPHTAFSRSPPQWRGDSCLRGA